MSKKKKKAIRVAVGSSEEPFAGAWKLWVNHGDAYLAARTLGGMWKVSMHPNYWRAAFTMTSGKSDPKGEMFRWVPPPDIAPGIALGPRVSIPRFEGAYDRPPWRGIDVKGVEWIPVPQVGHCVALRVVFTRDGTERPSSRFPGVDREFGPLAFPDGRGVWLETYEHSMPEQEFQRLQRARDDVVVTFTTEEATRRVNAAAIEASNGADGTPQISYLVLTSRNFRY